MTADLERLLNPASMAVIGGGVWGRSVIRECRKLGFKGEIFVVHPKADEVEGLTPYRHVDDLPIAPDASFIGVNREATIEVVGALSAKGAGGAVCFASGFLEADAEDADGAALQEALIEAAGDMPFIGPNCYGFVNYLDQFCIWPDQHGGKPVSSGVAIVTQSSNIMINLTMQARGLPIAYAMTAGNQAQTSLSALGRTVLSDPRVTALGLHIEGIGDIADFEALANIAADLGKPIVAVKVGRSDQAQAATISHTASLAGSDAGADALLKRLGVGRADSLSEMMEVLKILHCAGPLTGHAIASMSCSGGEASLMADLAHLSAKPVSFPPLDDSQKEGLRAALGARVALANPLDYHTYIWGDVKGMADAFTAMVAGPVDMGVIVVDFPREDRCDPSAWMCVIEAAGIAQSRCQKPVALLSSLVENMPEALAETAMQKGLIALSGMSEGLAAISIAAELGRRSDVEPVWQVPALETPMMLDEATSKHLLAPFGLDIPGHIQIEAGQLPAELPFDFPVVLKAMGLAHKSEMGGVRIGLKNHAELEQAMAEMDQPRYLIEEMVGEGIAELLVGIVADPAHGYVLTIGAGGVLTELLADTASLVLPVDERAINTALSSLKMAPLLAGYRGKPAADMRAMTKAILALQSCVCEHKHITEIEINPLIITPSRAVAVDALIRKGE